MSTRPIKFATIGEGRQAKQLTLAYRKKFEHVRVEVGYYLNPENENCTIHEIQSFGFASFVEQAAPEELAALEAVITQLVVKARRP